ncbi:MAG: hypothetical protein GY795_06970 [Desulfobacterales bacterium]|nr:hypothetical protein [Desulfobacterales bacterium]
MQLHNIGESLYYAYYRNLSKGTMFLLRQQFEGLPESEWQNRIKTLESSFSYPIKIEKYTEMGMARDETGSILKGNIVIRQDYELKW